MRRRFAFAAALCLATGVGSTTQHASGTFEVKMQPLAADEKVAGLKVGRFGFDKQWKGDFEGVSKGEMMSTDPGVEGSGGYVAIEELTGTLKGRSGSFSVVHQGTMKKGADFNLIVNVVPDSGKGQLAGLAGSLKIVIADGKHSYTVDYTLPDAH